MNYSDRIRKAIDDGLEGKNLGLSMGSQKLNNLIGGVQYGRYDLWGGTTGCGKTAAVDFFYVIKPWLILRKLRAEGLTKRTMKVFYDSLEIRVVHKLAKWVAIILFLDHRVLVDIRLILSMLVDDGKLQENRMSEELYQLIMSKLVILDEMEEDIFLMEESSGPDKVYARAKEYADNNGSTESVAVYDKSGKTFLYNKNIYHANKPEELVLHIIDHVGLCKSKAGQDKKRMLDDLSRNCVSLRNKYNHSFVAISQFNRELADINRKRFSELTPQMEDFKDTGNTAEDAETVIAMFNPLAYNMPGWNGYNIEKLGASFRGMVVLKNRNGDASIGLGYNFIGACGAYRELPPGKEMGKEDYELATKNWKEWQEENIKQSLSTPSQV